MGNFTPHYEGAMVRGPKRFHGEENIGIGSPRWGTAQAQKAESPSLCCCFVLHCLFSCLFFETGSHYKTLLSWNSLRRPRWPLTHRDQPASARIRGVCHYVQLENSNYKLGCGKDGTNKFWQALRKSTFGWVR